MISGFVTLFSDFGDTDAFAGILKGALLSRAPRALLVDITHHLVPSDRFHSACTLLRVYRHFPAGTIHLLAADPTLGDAGAILAAAGSHWLLGPDDGALGLVLDRARATDLPVRAWRLDAAPPSSTFLARDVLAPAAAALLSGAPPESLAPACDRWRSLPWPEPLLAAGLARGEVLLCDAFGNLLTNLTPLELPLFVPSPASGLSWSCRIGGATLAQWRQSGGSPGPFVYWGAEGWLEIGLPSAPANLHFGVERGAPVEFRWRQP